MNQTAPKIPTIVTLLAGCLIFIVAVYVKVSAQTSAGDPISVSREVFSWGLAAVGFVSIVIAVGYGFVKKQKYENLETERNELKSLAESREERIKELNYTLSEREARLKLKISEKETDIVNLKESNSALVSQSLQMKAILRDLRLAGTWSGHEDKIHETR